MSITFETSKRSIDEHRVAAVREVRRLIASDSFIYLENHETTRSMLAEACEDKSIIPQQLEDMTYELRMSIAQIKRDFQGRLAKEVHRGEKLFFSLNKTGAKELSELHDLNLSDGDPVRVVGCEVVTKPGKIVRRLSGGQGIREPETREQLFLIELDEFNTDEAKWYKINRGDFACSIYQTGLYAREGGVELPDPVVSQSELDEIVKQEVHGECYGLFA